MNSYLPIISAGTLLGVVLSGWGYVVFLTYEIPGASLAYYAFFACVFALGGALTRLLRQPVSNVAFALSSVLLIISSLALVINHPAWERLAERMAIASLVFLMLGLVVLWWRIVRPLPDRQ